MTTRRSNTAKWHYLYGLLVQELDQLRSRVLILEQRDGDQERAADQELASLERCRHGYPAASCSERL